MNARRADKPTPAAGQVWRRRRDGREVIIVKTPELRSADPRLVIRGERQTRLSAGRLLRDFELHLEEAADYEPKADRICVHCGAAMPEKRPEQSWARYRARLYCSNECAIEGRVADRTGQRFGRLLVVCRAGSSSGGLAMWKCKCDCGNTAVVTGDQLNQRTRSCGCLVKDPNRERFHRKGMAGHPLYAIWVGMRQRCSNPSNPAYKDYGGRGISVAPEWQDFATFAEYMGDRPGPEYSIDRIDNDGNYEPGNVRWATPKEQVHNRRVSRRAA